MKARVRLTNGGQLRFRHNAMRWLISFDYRLPCRARL